LPENYKGPVLPTLTNIIFIYLPPNTTSRLQPLDQAIIPSFKYAYYQQYTNFMVRYFNANNQVLLKLNILSTIHLMAEAWEAIPTSTIQNS
ncbi:CENP-B protein, partial [Choiromyces venosus 120613-1]